MSNVRCTSNETQLHQCSFNTNRLGRFCRMPFAIACQISTESNLIIYFTLLSYATIIFMIYVGIPGAPQNIRISNTSSSTISLTWSTPLETYGLTIFRYIINCSTDSRILENAIHYTDIHNATLFNLHPFTTYNCCVAANSNHGRGKLACQSTVTWDEGTHCALSM